MDAEQIDRLRRLNPAWKLLRAQNAPLILSFLGRYFIEENHGATAASTLTGALDDELYGLNDQAVSLGEPAPYPRILRIIWKIGRRTILVGCAGSTRWILTSFTTTPRLR